MHCGVCAPAPVPLGLTWQLCDPLLFHPGRAFNDTQLTGTLPAEWGFGGGLQKVDAL